MGCSAASERGWEIFRETPFCLGSARPLSRAYSGCILGRRNVCMGNRAIVLNGTHLSDDEAIISALGASHQRMAHRREASPTRRSRNQ